MHKSRVINLDHRINIQEYGGICNFTINHPSLITLLQISHPTPPASLLECWSSGPDWNLHGLYEKLFCIWYVAKLYMCNCNIVAASHITHALHVRCISNKVACRYSRIRGADKHHQDSRGAENGGDRKGTGTRTAQRQPAYARPACFMFRHTQRPPLRYIYIFSSQNLSTPSR